MGMDAYIYRAKSKKIFEDSNWYDKVEESWYARRFWEIVRNASFIDNVEDDAGEFIRLRKKDIEEILNIAIHTEDYWGGFDSVPALCRILYDFDDDKENGWHYYFYYSY